MSVVLMGAAGVTIDYYNLSNTRSQMQNAADTAALAAAREKGKSDTERKALARTMFDANLPDIIPDRFEVTFPGNSVRVDASANITNFLGIFIDAKTSAVGVTSVASGGGPQTAEIAFALDVSGSMNYSLPGSANRLAALQTAVGDLISQLEASATPGVTIKAALVPFTNAVNIGVSNASLVTNANNPLFAGTSWFGCVFERPQPDTFADTARPRWGAYIWPPMPNVVGTGDYSSPRSNGTMTGYQSIAESPSDSNSQLAGPNYNCTRYPIVPLTADLEKIRTAVSSYQSWPNMGTQIAAGVSWGMRVLSPQAPFTEGSAYGSSVRKILIVITDGEQVTDAELSDGIAEKSTNSVARWRFNPAAFGLPGKIINTGFGPSDNLGAYGFLRDSEPFGVKDTDAPNVWEQNLTQLAQISTMACDEVKRRVGGRQIDVFTLGISTDTKPGTRVYDTLHDCASKPENHFYVTDTAGLKAAFDKILSGTSLVRLTQ